MRAFLKKTVNAMFGAHIFYCARCNVQAAPAPGPERIYRDERSMVPYHVPVWAECQFEFSDKLAERILLICVCTPMNTEFGP